jgi:hypothetical protein
MQPITSPYKTLHVVHKQHMHRKVKQDTLLHFYRYYMHQGLPCSKKKLASTKLHEVVPHERADELPGGGVISVGKAARSPLRVLDRFLCTSGA